MREHDRRIGEMFDRVAPRYDLLNRVLSFGTDLSWRRRALRLARLGAGERALDVGAGTGDLTFALLRGSAADASVVAVDLSPKMLALLRGRARSVRAEAVLGSATALPVADASVDRVIAGFALRNFGDALGGLREFRRVLRPGGRAVVLELSTPPGRLLRTLYRFYFHRVAPRLAVLLGGDPTAYRYLPASVDRFPGAEGLADLFRQAGFRTVRFERLTFGIAAIHVGEP